MRRFASFLLLLLLLALPAAGAGAKAPAAQPTAAGAVGTLAGSLRLLWQTALHLVAPAGSSKRPPITPDCDLGPGMDPDGRCHVGNVPRPTLGIGMDPDG